MKYTIEELWRGDIAPSASCGVGDPEIEKLVMLLERHRNVLDGELGQQQKADLEQYASCMDRYACLLSARAFRDGFCIGARLMSEALTEEL